MTFGGNYTCFRQTRIKAHLWDACGHMLTFAFLSIPRMAWCFPVSSWECTLADLWRIWCYCKPRILDAHLPVIKQALGNPWKSPTIPMIFPQSSMARILPALIQALCCRSPITHLPSKSRSLQWVKWLWIPCYAVPKVIAGEGMVIPPW